MMDENQKVFPNLGAESQVLNHLNCDTILFEQNKFQPSVQKAPIDSRRIKLLMLGDSGVGKSSLVMRWTQDTFSSDLVGTVGVNFKTKRTSVDGEECLVQVWDTAGQEQFHKLTQSYYRGVDGILLVYDIADHKSLDNVSYWVKNIKSHATDSVQVALVGNKIDLRGIDSSICVDTCGANTLVQKYDLPYFETSAKDATNVDSAFQALVANVVLGRGRGHPSGEPQAEPKPESEKVESKKKKKMSSGCKQS